MSISMPGPGGQHNIDAASSTALDTKQLGALGGQWGKTDDGQEELVVRYRSRGAALVVVGGTLSTHPISR